MPRHDPRIEELLDALAALLDFSRAGTFDEAPGEYDVLRRASMLLAYYRPEAASTSSINAGSES
jgi:plasmid stabilization system protein ParE